MGLILGLLSRFSLPIMGIQLVAMAAFALFHFFQVNMLERTIESQTTELVEVRGDNTRMKVEIKDLRTSIDNQNKKVEEMAKAQQAASIAADAAIKQARLNAAKWKTQYDNLLNAPKPNPDDCIAVGMKLDQYYMIRKAESTGEIVK